MAIGACKYAPKYCKKLKNKTRQQASSIYAPRICNNIPVSICIGPMLLQFSKELKTHLFKLQYITSVHTSATPPITCLIYASPCPVYSALLPFGQVHAIEIPHTYIKTPCLGLHLQSTDSRSLPLCISTVGTPETNDSLNCAPACKSTVACMVEDRKMKGTSHCSLGTLTTC